MRRNLAEEMHLHQSVELARREFVFLTQGFEEWHVEEFVGGYAHADALGGEFRVEVCGERDLVEGVVGEEAGVVAVVAEVVEGFVGVLDGDFGAGWGGEEGFGYGGVEVGAVAVALVGGEDEELRDSGAVREG